MTRRAPVLLALTFAVLSLGGCAGDDHVQLSGTAVDVTVAAEGGGGIEDNTFIPEGQNLSDCVGTLPQPNCGSPDRGTRGAYLTMLALVLGVGFIAWRVSIGIRARDKSVNTGTDVSR